MEQVAVTETQSQKKRRDAAKVDRERRVIRRFIEVYCKDHHGGSTALCDECGSLLSYAMVRLDKCPYDPKPKCKKCPTHCYKPDMRQRMKQVMRYSGMYFVKRGRLDWLVLYFLS